MNKLVESSLDAKWEYNPYLKNARNYFSWAVIWVLFLANPALWQDIKQIDSNEIMLSVPLWFKYNSKKYWLNYEWKSNPALWISFSWEKDIDKNLNIKKVDSIGAVENFWNWKWWIWVLKNRWETLKWIVFQENFYSKTTISAELNWKWVRVIFSIPLWK